MKIFLTAIFTGIAGLVFAQSFPISGNVFTTDGSPMIYSSVVLLNPADSTMQAFGITNKDGNYDIKNIKKGEYLLQVAFLGYETFYKKSTISVENKKIETM